MPFMLKHLHQAEFDALFDAVKEENLRRQVLNIRLTPSELDFLSIYGATKCINLLRALPKFDSYPLLAIAEVVWSYHRYMED